MDKSQYFYRCAVFTRSNGKVSLADVHNPNHTSELEEWFGLVISLADGKHTLQELLNHLTNHYDQPPSNLEETLDSVIDRLMEGKLIQLSNTKVELPYYLESPIEALDLEKAKQLIEKNGYIYH